MKSCPPLHLGVVAIERGAFGSPPTKVTNNTFLLTIYGKLANNSTPSQSGPGSNGNERLLRTPQISRNGASASDTV